jgi:hypothetical protein
MNKIVREHYPVEKLPEDLRHSLPDGITVRLTLEADEIVQSPAVPAGRAWIDDIMRRKATMPLTSDDPVQRVRQLRDEWDD